MRANRLLMTMLAAAFLIVLPSHARAGNPARPAAIDVSLVTPDDFAAIVIHPRRIAKSPLVANLLKDEMIAGTIKKFGIDPSEVEEIVVLLSSIGDLEPMSVVIARFTHDVDAKQVLTRMRAAGPHGSQPIQEIKVGGKTCLDLGLERFDHPLAYVPSKKTIVLTSKEYMEEVLAVGEPSGPLYDRLKKASPDNDLIVAVETGDLSLDKIIDAAENAAPPFDLGVVKKLRGGTATFNLTAPRLLRVVLDTKDAGAAGDVEELLQQALRMESRGLVRTKQSMPKESQSAYGLVMKLAEQIVDGAKATKSGSQVTLDVKRPEILDTAGPSIVSAVKQSVLEARAAGRRAVQMNNMHQIGLAMLCYEAANRHFPPAATIKDGKPLLSWRVAILPYIDEDDLYKQFHLDEPWDSPHNRDVAKAMPSVFQSPDNPKDGKTRVMLFTGKSAAFDGGKKISNADIRDGASMTVMCVEAGADKAVPWTKPEDLPFDPEKPLAALGKVSPKGFIAAFFDGQVEQLKVDDKTLKALITPDGGEPTDYVKLHGGR